MYKKQLAFLIIGVLVIAAAVAYGYQRRHWQARVDNLQEQVDSTDTLIDQYVADSTARAARLDSLEEKDSLLTVDSARIAQRADSIEEVRLRTLRYLARQRATLAQDSLSPDIRIVLAAYDSALVTTDSARVVCEQGRTNAEKRAMNCEVNVAVKDSMIIDLEKLRDRLTSERDSAVVLLKPPSLFQFTFDLSVGVGCANNFTQTVCGASTQLTILRFRLPWP